MINIKVFPSVQLRFCGDCIDFIDFGDLLIRDHILDESEIVRHGIIKVCSIRICIQNVSSMSNKKSYYAQKIC